MFRLNAFVKRWYTTGAQKPKNIMIFASEVPVIAALNKYRQIDDVFRSVWERTNREQVEMLQAEMILELEQVESEDEKILRLVVESGAEKATTSAVEASLAVNTSVELNAITNEMEKQVESLPKVTEEAKKDIVEHFVSEIRKDYGSRVEASAIQHYEEKTERKVQENNAKFYSRSIGKIKEYEVLVGGRIDGKTGGRVVEVKNRMKRFMNPLPAYDIAQLQTYLYILDGKDGELIEHLRDPELKTHSTIIPRDQKQWSKDIQPYLLSFARSLALFMNDHEQQRQFLLAPDAEIRKNIIRSFWMQ